MPDTTLDPPFPAYSGEAPFVFVSYAHKDAAAVFPELCQLRDAGYRVWYDEGIDPGHEWPEAIADALGRAAHFLVFLSPAAVASRNVKNEIHLALQRDKPFLAVYLCETELPPGLQLSISSIQAVLKYRTSASNYRRSLERALPAALRETPARQPGPAAGTVPASPPALSSVGPVLGRPWTVPDLGLELVPIAAGSFMMGSENGAPDEKPVHAVRISRAFWMGKYEVTQGEYEAITGKAPSRLKGARNPVETVSWHDAVGFCRALTQRELAASRLPVGYEYRLPTETEWEYACRAGTTGDYAGNVDDMAWYDDTPDTKIVLRRGAKAHEVGTKKANPWGLYDMHGNVWEWSLDWYDESYYGRSPGTDPVNGQAASGRVVRGGGWNSSSWFVRSAYRGWFGPGDSGDDLGFRACLAPRCAGQ